MNILISCERSGIVRREFISLGHNAWSCDLAKSKDEPPNEWLESHPEYEHRHFQEDCLEVARRGITTFESGPGNRQPWDLMIAHPPCTYLCCSGMHWVARGRIEEDGRHRREHVDEALEFFSMILNMDIPHIAIENPVGCVTRRLGQLVTGGKWVVKPWTKKVTCPYTQIIQPYQFGDDASKATCLWLKGLPPLKPTKYIPPRAVCSACGFCEYAAVYVREDMFSKGCPECGADAAKVKPRWGNQTDSGQNKLGPSEDRAEIRAETYTGIARAMAQQWGNIKS